MSILGNVRVGANNAVRIMGIINTSPESFLASSVSTTRGAIANTAKRMEDDGADIIDVGGMSSAPYKSTMVSVRTETERVIKAVRAVADKTNVPISVDTCRAIVADAALHEGATIINDVTGLHYDPQMRQVISHHRPSLILCAHSTQKIGSGDPVMQAATLLKKSIRKAKSYKVSASHIVLDPAIGFFRRTGNGSRFTRTSADWAVRDLLVLGGLRRLRLTLRSELLVSVSNKSFLGAIIHDASAEHRLASSLAAEVTAAIGGASVIRTHNVEHTRRALDVLSR